MMYEILQKIDGLFVTPNSEDTDKQNAILREYLPFKVYEYTSGQEHNGWVVPSKWEVKKAQIHKNGKLVYDGTKHPLCVIGYSQSFSGRVSLEELKKHLYYRKESPNDIVYHCDLYYKPHRKLWGFCVPYNIFKNLETGEYEVDLQTIHEQGTMKVLEYTHAGKSEDIIVFNAHNCHASQLNDGPAGYAVFMEVMKRLSGQKTRFTYRLIVAPEHLGTVFYLARLSETDRKKFKLGIFMEMVGHDNPRFSLQESFTGKSYIDKVAHHVLRHKSQGYWSDRFRQIIGNDESVWEAPGYEVPMISLSRCQSQDNPYPQYHLSSDNLDIIRKEKLEETADILMHMIFVCEKDCLLQRKFSGLVALSNPRYDLYIVPGTDPSISLEKQTLDRKKWTDLMNDVPRYMDKNMTVLEISEKYDLPFDEVYEYLKKFEAKGLVEFVSKDVMSKQ